MKRLTCCNSATWLVCIIFDYNLMKNLTQRLGLYCAVHNCLYMLSWEVWLLSIMKCNNFLNGLWRINLAVFSLKQIVLLLILLYFHPWILHSLWSKTKQFSSSLCVFSCSWLDWNRIYFVWIVRDSHYWAKMMSFKHAKIL